MEWISVEEKLPPMNERFDVWDKYHECRLADHGAFVGQWDDDFRKDTMLIKGYTHWMPIPPPPSSSNIDYAKLAKWVHDCVSFGGTVEQVEDYLRKSFAERYM